MKNESFINVLCPSISSLMCSLLPSLYHFLSFKTFYSWKEPQKQSIQHFSRYVNPGGSRFQILECSLKMCISGCQPRSLNQNHLSRVKELSLLTSSQVILTQINVPDLLQHNPSIQTQNKRESTWNLWVLRSHLRTNLIISGIVTKVNAFLNLFLSDFV